MMHSTYFLDRASYTWQNAIFWGYFFEHCKKASQGNWKNKTVHTLMATAELLPFFSQIFSICEKLLIDNCLQPSSRLPGNHKFSLKSKADQRIPNPSTSKPDYKKQLLADLSENIANQELHKTYKRPKLKSLDEQRSNLPIPIASLSKRVKYFSNATFYSYNAEGISDYGWGCAFRAIQTCLSVYGTNISFETLFHLFGPLKNLELIYHDKYPTEQLSTSKLFAPYDLSSGWAEPFIAHMVMHFYGIPSELEVINGIPGSCHAPHQVFHNEPLEFSIFRERLKKHFKVENPAPVMIDDGTFSLNIIGMEKEGINTILWIADPHINEGVNHQFNKERSPVGLYTITLNEIGEQISCSLNDKDKHQISQLFNAGSYEGLHFSRKSWMVLFPNPHND